MGKKFRCQNVWIAVLTIAIVFGLSRVHGEKEEGSSDSNGNEEGVVKWNKTGNPQIDYLNDPNLPRELQGYNLSTWPFYNKVPKDINFTCDGLKDGFYASVEHQCQLYHHCLFGTRYDFLCANYTAFDQRTFICTFISNVDCPNSALYFHRNDDLYVTATTTTLAPPYFSSSSRRARPRPQFPRPEKIPAKVYIEEESEEEDPVPVVSPRKVDGTKVTDGIDDRRYSFRPMRRRCGPRRRRRCRRPRPRPVYYDYEDYYDYDDDGRNKYQAYDDYEYEEEELPKRRKNKQRATTEDSVAPGKKRKGKATSPPSTTTTSTTTTTTEAPETAEPDVGTLLANRDRIFSQHRSPPKIRPPVPKPKGSKYATQERTTTSPTVTKETEYYEYYEDDYDSKAPVVTTTPKPKEQTQRTTTTTTTKKPRTTTTTTEATALYEYEYEDAEEEPSTTSKPRGIARSHHGTSTKSSTVLDYPAVNVRNGAIQHDKITSALEAPSRVPSLRQPYLNRPRPSATIPPFPTSSNYYDSSNAAPGFYSPEPETSSSDSSRQRQQRFRQQSPSELPILSHTPSIVAGYDGFPQDYQSPKEYSPTREDYSNQREVGPSYPEATGRSASAQRRRQPTSGATDSRLKFTASNTRPQFISLMHENDEVYYNSQGEQTQNVQVQITPGFTIPAEYPEPHTKESLFSNYRPVRSSLFSRRYPLLFQMY